MDSAGIISSLFHVVFSELTHMSQVSAGATGMVDMMGYLGFFPHSLSSSRRESSKRTMSKTSKFYKATVQVSHNVTSTILYLSKRVTRQPRLDSTSWCEKLQNVCGCFYIPKGLVCKSVFLPTAQDFLFIENKLLFIKIFDLNAEEWLVDKCCL